MLLRLSHRTSIVITIFAITLQQQYNRQFQLHLVLRDQQSHYQLQYYNLQIPVPGYTQS